MTDRLLPVFAYGTLRPAMRAHNWCADEISRSTIAVQPAVLPGHRLRLAGQLPYVVAGDGSVTGDLLTIDTDDYDHIIRMLDRYEGYHPDYPGSMYVRDRRETADLLTGVITPAWVYLGGTVTRERRTTLVAGGDYLTTRKETRHAG